MKLTKREYTTAYIALVLGALILVCIGIGSRT